MKRISLQPQREKGKENESALIDRVKRPVSMSFDQYGQFLTGKLQDIYEQDPSRYDLKEAGGRARLMALAMSEVRSSLRRNLETELNKIRRSQMPDYDPSYPKNKFARRLLEDVNNGLADYFENLNFDLSDYFDLEFYSAADTLVDFALGADCWIDLVALNEKGKPVESAGQAFIDITTNQEKAYSFDLNEGRAKGKNTDFIFLFDQAHLQEDEEWERHMRNNVKDAIFETPEYKKLVEGLKRLFIEKIKLSPTFKSENHLN